MMKLHALGVAFALAFSIPAQAAVVNGNFDDISSTTVGKFGKLQKDLPSGVGVNNTWDVYQTIPGWTTVSGQGIEIQTKNTVGLTPHSGAFYVELDSDPSTTNGVSSNTRMQQSLSLNRGRYELSFYYSPRLKAPNASNGIAFDIELGPLLTGSVVAADGEQGKWTLITRSFFVKESGSYTLGFEANQLDDKLGGFIDTVAIAPVPLPAAGWMLIAGLGALGAVARKRKAVAA
jgi:hypothetical protein